MGLQLNKRTISTANELASVQAERFANWQVAKLANHNLGI